MPPFWFWIELHAPFQFGQGVGRVEVCRKRGQAVGGRHRDHSAPQVDPCHHTRLDELRYKAGELWSYMSVLWGFAEVTPSKVTILAEVAEKAEDIDVDRAQAAVAEAERRLEMGGLPSEVEAAKVSLEKARLRKKLAERTHRTHA